MNITSVLCGVLYKSKAVVGQLKVFSWKTVGSIETADGMEWQHVEHGTFSECIFSSTPVSNTQQLTQ